MTRVNDPIAIAFTGGVSQQAPWLRFPTQLETQDNAWTSLTRILAKRHPFDYVKNAFSTHGGKSFIHDIVNSDTEQYRLIIGHEDLRLQNLLTGEMHPVYGKGGAEIGGTGPANFSYLKALTTDPYSLPNPETCASLDSATGGWKGGTATAKTLSTAAAVGP